MKYIQASHWYLITYDCFMNYTSFLYQNYFYPFSTQRNFNVLLFVIECKWLKILSKGYIRCENDYMYLYLVIYYILVIIVKYFLRSHLTEKEYIN